MIPRVAFFTDSFHEANGVALTSREFADFARTHFYPFFSVHTGPKTAHFKRGRFETFELAHSRGVLGLEHDLAFDLLFLRHRYAVSRALQSFRPDVIHVTGPSHCGMLGALLAHRLRIPLVASWHTNVHEFAGRRLRSLLDWMPENASRAVAQFAEGRVLDLTLRFYRLAQMTFAPNPELVSLLTERTGRPCHLMQRGIDTDLFTPTRRRRTGGPFVIGYTGRLSAEKNVRMLATIDQALRSEGQSGFRFKIVGEGTERAWLRANLPDAEVPGLLKGEALADAYADMDVFVFPSETDTFGNVVLEAMASGVPTIVSDRGGPKYLVKDGISGRMASDARSFARAVIELRSDEEYRRRLAAASREAVMGRSWSTVFDNVYQRYYSVLSRADDPVLSTARSQTFPA